MKTNKSIYNWEVYQKMRGDKPKIKKNFKTYKKPILGRMWDKLCVFGQKLIKRPIFFVLTIVNLVILAKYIVGLINSETVDMYRWVTTISFVVFFGYFTFYYKN